MENEEIVALEKIMDERYVRKSSCNDIQEKNNRKFANDDKRIEIIVHDFNTIKWLVATVAASGIGALVVNIADILMG